MDLGAMLIALCTGVLVKVAVMLLAARLVLKVYRPAFKEPGRLWRILPQEGRTEVRVLWWALVLFFVSELTCGIEVYVILQANPVTSITHSLTSFAGMGLFGLGLYLHLDRKSLRFTGPKCFLTQVCGKCTVNATEGCKFHPTTLYLATLVALAALPAFLASTAAVPADLSRWVLPIPSWNHWYDQTLVPWLTANVPRYEPNGLAFEIPSAVWVVEYRLLPATAIAVALTGLFALYRKSYALGTSLVVFATGGLAYVVMELLLYAATGDALIGSLAHEVIELWFLLAAAELLYRCYGKPAVGAGNGVNPGSP